MGKRKVQTFKYLESKKSFFGKIKNIFIILKCFLLVKYIKIEDTSFEVKLNIKCNDLNDVKFERGYPSYVPKI